MQTLASALIKLVLVTLVFHDTTLGQYDIIENFDPEKELPESDLLLLNNLKFLHNSLTPESTTLLTQLSFLSAEEILALEEFKNGKLGNVDNYPRLKILTEHLWSDVAISKTKGTFLHRMNRTDGIQYKWFGTVDFGQFTVGGLGERDPQEVDILDYHSLFLKTKFQNFDYNIGNYQMLLGHGLVSWRSIPVKSDFGTTNSALRRGRGIQPFRSGHESWAYQGLGWTQPLRQGILTAGISYRNLDGSLERKKFKTSNSGLHVSKSQIENRGNISETVGIADWGRETQHGHVGFILGGAAWNNDKDNLTNLATSVYGNYQVSNWQLFSELAYTSQNKNAIVGGGKLKHKSFHYGFVLRKIDPDYFALRDNVFRNWNNQELGEMGVLQEIRFRLHQTMVNIYSDLFSRIRKIEGEFQKYGHETGINIEHRFNTKLRIQSKLKIQESSSEHYDYTEYQSSAFPVSTFKTTIKWTQSKRQSYQCQIQEKHNLDGNPSSWGIQFRWKHLWDRRGINIYWVTARIDEKNWLYYWDVNLPGEMKSKVFTQSGHYLGSSIYYHTSDHSEIHLRLSTAWNSWNFDIVPIFRGALQINVSI